MDKRELTIKELKAMLADLEANKPIQVAVAFEDDEKMHVVIFASLHSASHLVMTMFTSLITAIAANAKRDEPHHFTMEGPSSKPKTLN